MAVRAASHRNIEQLPADGGPSRPVTNFPEPGLFLEEPTISPDGRWLVYLRSKGASSLWLLTLGDSYASPRCPRAHRTDTDVVLTRVIPRPETTAKIERNRQPHRGPPSKK